MNAVHNLQRTERSTLRTRRLPQQPASSERWKDSVLSITSFATHKSKSSTRVNVCEMDGGFFRAGN